ncbi:diaminopimelate decarboxylase [Halolamina rubra]|uniref:diaminopimelate decarboxylase n=1 Tax=Halolamina rubra TaxID=1380430 RepID=UPI0009E47B9A|nr:diaminopimelate decarboxylase [Halolamina rubra]
MTDKGRNRSIARPEVGSSQGAWLEGQGEGLLTEYGSPLFVLDETELRQNYRDLRNALDEHYPDTTVHFAAKANYNLAVLSVLRDAGCSAEAYARCEFDACTRAGFAPADILLTGMNRRPDDIERALEAGVEYLLVDNAAELERVIEAAGETNTHPRVLVRTNPSMDVPTHPDIATATHESKFGLDVASGRAMDVARSAAACDRIELAGIQLHIGSQLRSTEPYVVAAREMLAFAADIRAETGTTIDVLDLGGGFPVAYDEAVPETADVLAALGRAIRDAAATHDLPEPHLFLEPGRRLVASAASLVTTVGSVKETPYATFAVLDAGTNLVSSHWPHPVQALTAEGPEREYDIVGPLCYTGDVHREGVTLPELSAGDVVSLNRVGAYSIGDASHTNADPKPAVVMRRVDGGIDLIRERETCADILGLDRIPTDLTEVENATTN